MLNVEFRRKGGETSCMVGVRPEQLEARPKDLASAVALWKRIRVCEFRRKSGETGRGDPICRVPGVPLDARLK